MKLADEIVASGFQRADAHGALRLSGDHLFDLKIGAVELLRRDILVDDGDHHALISRDLQLAWSEFMVLDGQRVILGVRGGGRKRQRGGEREEGENGGGLTHGVSCCLLYTSPSPRDRQKSR